MIPKEILKKIRRIQITTNRLVTDTFAGKYHSVFKGRGMEFDEVREYFPGDDISSIDWNVTARMNHPYVKKFVEERELTIIFLLDVSGSFCFGTQNQLKSQLAAEICAVLSFSAIKNNDKVGLIAFSDKIEKFVPPRKGTRHILRIIRESLYCKAQGEKTDIKAALDYLNRIMNRKTITFIISDFYDQDFRKQLIITSKRHDLIAIKISDPAETSLPATGIIDFKDPETGDFFSLDTQAEAVRTLVSKNYLRHHQEIKSLMTESNVDLIELSTDVPYTDSLVKFFRKRERKKRLKS